MNGEQMPIADSVLLSEELSSYQGWSLQMTFYTISHSELVLRLESSEDQSFKYLVLSGCGDVRVDELCEVKDIRITRVSDLSWCLELAGLRVVAEVWRIVGAYPFPAPP